MLRWRSRSWTILTFIGACSLIAIWLASRGPVPDLVAAWPTPGRIDTLQAFAQRSGPISAVDDYSIHLPALPPSDFYPVEEYPDAGSMLEAEPEGTPWRVSAILMVGTPVAILNGQSVRPGDRLDDGARVEGIERDRVVLVDDEGRTHVLRISPGE